MLRLAWKRRRLARWVARLGIIETLEQRSLLSVSISATADATVQRSAVDAAVQQSNFGQDAQLRIDASENSTAESFLRFNLDQAGDVGSAILKLHGGRANGSDVPVLVGAFSVPNAGWVEGDGTTALPDTDNSPADEITWNARPATSGAALDAAHVTRTGDYYWNVTSYVRAQKEAGASAVSFALRNVDGTAGLVTFDASEAGSAGPVLIVEPNAAGPDASFTAPNITAAAPTQLITATYTDTDAVNADSIDVNDIVVTAPGRPAAEVASVVVTQTSPTSVTAVYTVTGPGGSWDTADSALYTALLQSGQVTDVAGNTAAGGPDAFFVTIGSGSVGSSDTARPTAQINTSDVTQAGGATGSFTVTYSDDGAVNVSTIDVGDVVVVRPGSPNLRVTGVEVTPATNGSPITATYTFNAPGGSWSELDNGTYQVQLLEGAVADLAGKLTPALTDTFAVAVPISPPPAGDTTAPTAVVAELPPITVADVTTQQIQVTYTDDVAIDVASVDVSDVTVSLNGLTLPVVGVSANPPADSDVITAIYTVSAPGTAFSLADNGTFTITVAQGAVVDTSGNASTTATGSLVVALPAPRPTLDPTFGAGIVTADMLAEASAVQPDGRILIAGRTGDIDAGTSKGVLQRFNPDGSLDRTFGNDGQVVTAGGNEAYYAMQLTATGAIVVAGTSDGDFAVTRFRSNGTADRTFGNGGRALANFEGTDVAYAVAVAPDDSIVVGGSSSNANGTSFALARFLHDGKPDPFFGEKGRSLFLNSPGEQAIGAVAIQSDGKIIAAGSSGASVNVVRVGVDGLQDNSYGDNGVAVVTALAARGDLGGPDYTVGLALQPDDTAVVSNRTADGDFGIARLTTGGQLDPAFGSGGVRTVDFGGDDDADQVFFQGTGEVFVVGTTTADSTSRTAVVALGRDGTLDSEFGTGGKLVIDTVAANDRALHIGDLVLRAIGSVGPDGRLVVGSSFQNPATPAPQTGLRRLNIPGSGLVGLFGAVAGRTRPLNFVDDDGTLCTFTLKGGGTARAFYDGANIDVVISGSTPQTVLKLRGSGGNGRISLRNLQSDGPLKGLQANTSDLTGTLSVNGAVRSIKLGTVTGTIATSGGIGSVQLLGDFNGGRVMAGANLGSDGRFGGSASEADGFASASINSLLVRGRANAALVTAGVDPRNGIFLDNDDQLVGGSASTIGSIKVRGGADLSSRFVAGQFGTARLPDVSNPNDDSRLQTL